MRSELLELSAKLASAREPFVVAVVVRREAARAMGATLSRRPVPWLGSASTGRWLSDWSTGIAEMSSVLRV